MPMPGPICPYCGQRAVLSDASAVYGPKFTGQFNLWVCAGFPDCDAYVGVHANSPNAAAMGSMANARLRKLRRAAHEAFDQLWKSGRMKRSQAYRELERIMNREKGKAHIAGFDEDQCLKLVMALADPDEDRHAGAA